MIKTKRSRDTKQDPGPKSNFRQSFFIWHWNLHKIITFKSLHHHSQFWCCILIRNLTLSISNDDESLEVPGYIVYLEQTIQYQTRGYYRNSLPLENLGIQYLQECINLDIIIERKSWKFVSLYRLANQSQEDFE